MDEPVIVPYAAPPRWPRRRIIRWAILGLLAVIAVAIIAQRTWPVVRVRLNHASLLREQNRWMNFSLPAEQVVYEEDPAAGAQLLQNSANYRRDEFMDSKEAAAWGTPVYWLRPVLFRSDYQSDPGLFLHRRISPSGHERIVAMSPPALDQFCRHYREIAFPYSVGKPATRALTSKPAFDSFAPHTLPLNGDERLCLYAGQPDPSDLSHWTIRYQINGTSGTIDGWLLDNDHIWLQVRDGPATGRLLNPWPGHPRHQCPLPHP